jgi:hypothetical protein
MANGRPFTDAEKAYIVANAPARSSWGGLAADLAHNCPGGERRNGEVVRNWYRRHIHNTGIRVTVTAEVTGDVAVQIHNAGLTPAEVGALVCMGLAGRARS